MNTYLVFIKVETRAYTDDLIVPPIVERELGPYKTREEAEEVIDRFKIPEGIATHVDELHTPVSQRLIVVNIRGGLVDMIFSLNIITKSFDTNGNQQSADTPSHLKEQLNCNIMNLRNELCLNCNINLRNELCQQNVDLRTSINQQFANTIMDTRSMLAQTQIEDLRLKMLLEQKRALQYHNMVTY